MSQSLNGKTAVVTGASSGIGAATAAAFARNGADVVVAARREERLESLAADLESAHDATVEVVPTDVTDEAAVESLIEAAVEAFDGIDVLVNNAGLAAGSDIAEMSTDSYRTMMSVNCDGMFYATRAAIPHLRESEGTLVFMGSFAGQYPRPFNPVYAATKWWTRGFAKSVSAQVGDDFGVTVVNPAAVRTEFAVEGEGEFSSEPFEEQFAPGEAVEPEEVADAVVFAAKQSPSMVSELDIYDRDKLTLLDG
ncbi:SDR family oxidoreductase [Halosegnis marinus]|uniref:SDR family oxidoreductase n=1 Tax=Halosegnis marinus TaxID=3034023 RepID=A0ABD5ZN77_9EURY|nr:SDR family oxidoreductase [Halosegnis sp. DT85]